jgi:hypothetical protein
MSTKRKIEDYKDQKVAIHCSTQEEWDKIVNLLPSGRSVKKNCWQNSVNNGKSDTINIEGYGWSPKKHFENTGYTIYPASDFLEKESVNSLLENEIYYNFSSNNIVRWKNSTGGNYLGNGCTIYKSDYGGNFHNNVKQYRLTTPEEKHWFLECEKANKFIPYDKAMETFGKPKPDEIPLKQTTMNMQEIQQICKEKYPIGCKYKCVNFNFEHILLQDDCTYTIVNNEIWASYGKGCLYSNGKYAELISLPKSDWNPQIGDKVLIKDGCEYYRQGIDSIGEKMIGIISNVTSTSLPFTVKWSNVSQNSYNKEHLEHYVEMTSDKSISLTMLEIAKSKYPLGTFYIDSYEGKQEVKGILTIQKDMITDGRGGAVYEKGKWAKIVDALYNDNKSEQKTSTSENYPLTPTKSVTKKKREITLVPLIQPKTVKVFDREENFF